jgi:hypothetical protein
MANDGGVYYSDRKFDMDGGFEWKLGSGLVTLQPQSSFAGVSLPGKAAALYFGVPDDDNFFSPDGGNTWFDPQTQCGDCGAWFSDPAQPTRVLEFGRRDQGGAGGAWYLWVNARGAYPDPARDGTPARPLPEPFFDYNVAALKGYKPIILTLSNENLSDDGDYILIRRIPTTIKEFHGIMRTTQLSKISDPADWNTKASLVMPVFLDGMQNADIVQASGGHKNTVFYVGDTQSLWRLNSGSKQWQPIVPAKDGTANSASRFFVDPYNPTLIYIIDKDGIKRSDNAGDTWILDKSLDNLVTDGKSFSYDITPLPIFSEGAVITDMVFDRFERSTRFAVGNAGVFFTLDGQNWKQLLSTTAVPGHPVAGYFDNLNRAFYVAMNGRGILQLSPIPKFSQICGIACLIGFEIVPGVGWLFEGKHAVSTAGWAIRV